MSIEIDFTKPSPKPRTRRLRAAFALAAMAIAVLGLFALDSMRKPQETPSQELRAQRQLAAAELQYAIDIRREAARIKLDVRREAAKAILEYAVGDEKTDDKQRVKPDPEGRKDILAAKMKRLKESELAISGMYYPLNAEERRNPALLSDKEAIGQLATASPKDLEAAIDRMDVGSASTSSNPFRKFVDADSPLFHVFNVSMIGLIAVFAIAGLYLLLILSEVSGIRNESSLKVGELLAEVKAGGAKAALLMGAAATVGVAGVGTAMAITAPGGAATGASHKQVLTHLPGGEGMPPIVAPYTFSENNTFNRKSDNPSLPPEIKVLATMPSVPVDIKATDSWTAATAKLNSSTRDLSMLSTELRSLAETIKKTSPQPAPIDIGPLSQQMKALAEGAAKLLENSRYANGRINALAAQVLINDCYSRLSDSALMDGVLQVEQIVGDAAARIKSGGCEVRQKR
jgi:hypothetical protein